MGKRGPSAQYAYGITIEAGNYNEVINGFEKRLKDLDKVTKNTTQTFAALSTAMKSGKQVDFGKAEGQLTGLVAEMEEVAKWREQLAGGQKLSDMFDGLDQVKQQLGQVTGQLDKFGANIEEIFSILQNVPQNTSKTFVDVRKVLQRQASDMNKIIAELNNPTEKTDVSALKNQLSGLATDFVNEWNKAASQGIKMDQVVDFKPFATIIKSAISGARSLGAEFNDVSASVTEATKNVVALYSVKHPTGMFKDIAAGMSNVGAQSKKAEQSVSKIGASFKAAISIVDKFSKSDMGLAKKSKEMDEFLAKLKNPKITIDLKNKDITEEFTNLEESLGKIIGDTVNITPDFLKNLPIDSLKELGNILQNIVAMWNEYGDIISEDLGKTAVKQDIEDYKVGLKNVISELTTMLNEASESTKKLKSNLQQMLEDAGLKDIKIELDISKDIDGYIEKINKVISDIVKQSDRFKKIPVTLAFDKKDDENNGAIETLKQNLNDLKKTIHDARTEINQDTRAIKQGILDALKINAKDMVNVRAALEDAFNIEPLEILINDEFLVNQIQNALKNKTYDISLNANINGANYSGGEIPVSGVGGGHIPVTQQTTTADKQEHASETQNKAAEEQKSAAQTNDKSAQLLSKASQEMTAFVKKFTNTYYRAKSQQKELDDKVASGETLTDKEKRRLSRVSGVVNNLNPINEYLKGIFGDKVNLSKITEEAMSKVLTGLMQSNGKGNFNGELLSEDLLGLLTGLKGKYRSKYGNGIGDLLGQLVGKNGKNGTLDAMFKSFGLNSATFAQTSARDYTAPDALKYYQSFARLADIIDSIKMRPEDVSNELLTELANILKGMQTRTSSEEYRANITEIGDSINALDKSIKDYNAKVAATADLDTKEGEDYTPLQNMFKEFYSKVDEATRTAISSAIGTNPSEDVIKKDQLVKAREALSTFSGDEASSKIASDLLRWLDRMIARDSVVISREKLLSQLGKGQKGSGLKIATSKNGKGQMTAYGIANNVLSDLDADIYYDGMGNPIVINRKDSPTQKRKSLRMVKNLGAKGRRFANGTQIYNKDNPRPKIEDERRPESSIEGTTDWVKRLATIDAELAKTSSEYDAAIKKRDEEIKQIEQKEQEISKQIDIARKNVEEAKGNLSDVSKGTDIQDSGDINNIKSAIRDKGKLYNLMVEMDKSYIPDFELNKRGIPVSDTYKQLIEERKKVSSRIKAAKGTSDFYKNIESSTSEDKSKYVKTAEDKISEIEASLLQLNTQLAEAKKVNDDNKIKYYTKLIVDKTNELESARDKLSNYKKIASGQTVSTEYDSRVAEQENVLTNLNAQINDELDGQKQQMDKDTYSLLLKIIDQYKERQSKLKGLEKDLSKYKEGSKEHDNILVQIDSLKTNLNSMIDEISEISSTLGLDNKDLENAFSGMSSDDFFSSKDTRRKLEKEVEALSTFKKDSLADVSIFPDELKDLLQRRNELLSEKSDVSSNKETLKKLRDELRSAKEKGNKQDIEFYKERIRIISEKTKEARPTKEINSEIKEIDVIIAQYIKSKISELKKLSQTKFDENTLSKYETDGSASDKYKKDVSDKSFILAQLEQEAKLLAKNKEDANSDVASLENKRKILEKQRELAQLQVDYNTKRMEELQLTEEIASLEKSDPSSEVLAQKRQQLAAVNAELLKMYKQIHAAGSTTSYETLNEDLSADQKKLIALEKIIEAQKIIAQNEEMQNRARAKVKDSSSVSNIKHDSETGKFTTQYGNESKLTRYTSDRFRSIYTQSEDFTQFRNALYEKAREEIASVESSLSQQVTEIIDDMSKDAIGKIVESKYGTKGAKAHETSWRISLQALDTELREALEEREYKIYSEYNEYISNISASDSLSSAQKENKISKALIERDSKISSLYSGGTEFKSVFDKKAQKFTQYYYRTLENLLGESERGLEDTFLKDILRQFKQLTMTSGKSGDKKQSVTEFGERVSNVLNQTDAEIDERIKGIYKAIDKKIEENIAAYMKEISSDETRLEGELANDVVFKDRMGNRINLAAEYRNANQYNLDRVTNLGQENKAQKEWIARLRKYGGISDEEMEYIQEARERALLKIYGGFESEIRNLDILIGDVDTTPIEEATKNIADKAVKAGAKAAQDAVDNKISASVVPETESVQQTEQNVAEQAVNKGLEGLNLNGISNETKSKLIDRALKEKAALYDSAIDGKQSKSRSLITPDSQKKLGFLYEEGISSSNEFTSAIYNLVDAIKAGKDVANVEYGFTERNGKRLELAVGDKDSVYYNKLSGTIDSMTHSHAYKGGINNMMFSIQDIRQMRTLAENNNLKKYNLIYGKEMMSMDLGKDNYEAARAVAQKYPIINDIVTAMFSTVDGKSVAAENSGEMARILNGYLQRAVSEAGGKLSFTDSSGLNVGSKYSITDDEYAKLNNVVANFRDYFDNNFGKITNIGEYTKVIREYLSKEFGKAFIDSITNKEYDKSKGGIGAEYSVEKQDVWQKLLASLSGSKKLTENEQALYDRLVSMPVDQLIAEKEKIQAALNASKEPEIKPTLTKAQIAALNPDDTSAIQKSSIKQFSKLYNWNASNAGNIEKILGLDNKTLVAYKSQFEELAKIALDLKTKGEAGTIITKDDISQLDAAITKTRELQSELTKEAQFKQMKDAGLIVNGKKKIKSTDSYSERQDIMAQYAKKYAAQNKSEYQFGQYDFINDKISFDMIDSAGQVTKVIMGWSDAFNTAYIQSSKLQGSLDKITQEVYNTDEAIKAGEEYGFFQEQSEGVKAYKDALAEYEAQVKAVAKSSQKDLAKNFEALHAAQEKVINAGKDLLDKQKDAYGFNNAQKVIGRTSNIDTLLQNYRDQGINVNDIELVRNYNDAIEALTQKFEELKDSGKLWDSNEQAGLKVLSDRAEEAEKALLKADEAQRQLKGNLIKGENARFFEGVDVKNVEQVKQAMTQYALSIKGVDAQSIRWNEDQQTLSYSVRNGKREISDFTIGMRDLTKEFYEARTGARTVQTGMEAFLSSIGDKLKEVGRYILSFGSFYRIWDEIKKGVTYVKEIDAALTELKKVTDETDATYAQFLKTMSQTGAEVGATVQDLTNMAANWARLGYSIEEAGELAKSTAVLLNVSEFTDADTASEALISTMQAYGYAAEDSMHVVDVLNEIGNNFAISSDGIATALQDSASSLMAAGNNLEQSVAMIAAANKVLQDPNSVGSALRTISLRIRGTSVKQLEELGEEVDGVVESTSKLQAKVKGLSGVDILTDTGAYKDTYTIIKEIAQVWDQMNDINRAALLELLAGKNRSNAMAALLTNLEDLEGAYEDAMDAQGSADAENEKYMNSIQGRIDQFTNSLQTMWKNTLSSSVVKWFVNAGTSIVKFVTQIGMIPTALAGVLFYFTAIKKNSPKNLFKDIVGTVTSFNSAINSINNLQKAGIAFNSENIGIYSAAISDLTAKQQALALSSAGLTKQQVAEVLAKNGCSDATIKQAIAETNLANAKTRSGVKTGEEIFNIIAETKVKLSNEATTWLVTHATDELTAAKIRAAIASGELSKAEGEAIIAMAGLSSGTKGLLATFKTLFLNNPVAWVTTTVAAISFISSKIKEHEKKIKESANNIIKTYNEAQDSLANNKNTIYEISSQYEILSRGVNKLGENVSLSTKEYEEYKNIVSQIESMFPSMVTGYNNEGVAILSCKGNVDELTKAYEENAKAAYAAAVAGQGDVWKDFQGGFWSNWNGKTDLEKETEAAKRLKEYLTVDENGTRYLDTINFDSSDETNDWIVALLEKAGFSQGGTETKEDFIKRVINDNIKSVNNIINQTINSYESASNPVKTILDAWLKTDQSDYSELSDDAKTAVREIVNGFSTDFIRSFDSITDVESYVSKIIDGLKDNNVSKALTSFMKIDTSKISVKDYKSEIDKFVKILESSGISEDIQKQILSGLKIDEDSIKKNIDPIIGKVKTLLKDEFKDKADSLTISELKVIDSDAFKVPDGALLTWDELKQKIQEAKVATIGDFNISDYADSISSISENIGVLQDALEKLNSGSFTMNDYVKLIKDFPKLANGVDVSSKSFKGLTSNLVRAIKASPKSLIKDLKALKLQLMQTGRSTADIDQLIYSLEHTAENALGNIITKYGSLVDTIKEAIEAQNELKAAMEENPNGGFETRGEAMTYMKEAMSRGEIGSESNLWNVAEKYGFTFDSAKSINENADALAKFIAIREKWFKQDDDGNYTYEGTEEFIKKVDAAVAATPELQEFMKWDYNENTGVLDFDFKNKDWDQIVKYLSTCEGLIGLTSDEWADMLVQVGQYFNIDWSNYNDELEYLKKITTEDSDNKTKVEKYGSAMQEYFGKDSSIDLANRPMVSGSKMKAKGWDVENGSYATVLSSAYSNEGETAAITVTPILPDGEVLTEEELTKYATEIVNGAEPAEYKFEVNGKTYTGEDIILAKHNGKNPIEEAKEYGQALHEAQEEYDKLRDTLNIGTTIDEKGIEGLSEIKEIQSSISKQSDGTVIINEEAFRKALTSAEYTEEQVELIIEKIKTLNKEAFASDSFNIGKILDKETGSGIDGLLEIKELQDAIKKDANTGFTVLDTDMFTSVLSEAGYAKSQIDELIGKIQEYENVVSVSGNTDPLGLNSANLSIDTLKASLSTFGVFFEDTIGKPFDGLRDLTINVPDLVSTLKEKGWSEESIRSYCEQLSQVNIEGFNIKVNSQEIDDALKKSDDVPEEKTTNYEVTGDGATTLDNIDNKWDTVTQDKTTNYTIVETTVKKTVEDDDSEASGTAVWYKPWTWFSNANGTANAQGNWGVSQDETSLVGELGTELLVRNGKWTTIGENGAEFANIKKGDIIFNHKQTEQLLKNGHISSRGKAYANGTAYVAGDGTFARYGFSENGGYQRFDVNGNVVDTFGNAAGSISDAADSMSDAADKFEETIDWFEILLEEIESDISLMNAQLENAVGISAKKGIYSQILNAEHYKVQELNEGIKLYSDYSAKLLAKIPEQYREMAKNGAVAIKDFVGEENEKVVEAINNYREWANKVKDLNQQLEETKKQISETRVQIQEMVKTEYTNKISLITVKNDQIQGAIDLREEQGERTSDVFYKAMIKNSKTQLSELKEQRKKMQEDLDNAVESGDVKKFSDDWYTMVNSIYEVDASIIDCETDIEGFQNSINDLHWENFDKIITAIDNVSDEAEQLRDLIDDDDIADDVGNWTDAGITSIGLLAQQMEKAKYRTELYGEKIKQLNKDYAAGKYSTDEYNEKLKELKDSQWDSIDAYESAKKAIIDVNKTRIEAVKDGIQKEIDAYDKLISKRKEDLSAQKDAHDFNKNVQDQQKEIDKIQRQIDAMEGDNSAAATAKRKKLQEELYQAQNDLAETYYDHDIETQQNALDKELEAYKQEKENRMEELDKYLENEEQVLADSLQLILENADGIDSFLKNISEKYGVSIYDAVVDPWSDGADALSKYLEMLKELKGNQEDIQKDADKDAKNTVNKIDKSTKDTISAEYVEPPKPEPKPNKPHHSSGGSYYAPSSVGVGSAVTVKSNATNFSRDGGNGTKMQGWVPGSTFTVMETSGDQVLIGIPGSGYTGWVNKSDLEGFAKGTKGVKSNQLAMIDENGLEELVLHADGNGKLAFLSKGTSVIPADITENLMKLGSIDPTEMLKRNTPSIGAPHITNNNMELNLEFGSLVHVDNCNQDTIPELQKMVRSEFDNMMKQVNSGLKRYTR